MTKRGRISSTDKMRRWWLGLHYLIWLSLVIFSFDAVEYVIDDYDSVVSTSGGVLHDIYIYIIMKIKTYTYIYKYMNIYKILLWCHVLFGQEFFVSAEVCDSRNWNSRSNTAWFERRLRGVAPRPSPCRVRSAHRRERGRVPSETSEKFQKYGLSRRNFGKIVES